jgi:catechol 2,3-dioxygenase-like lactoylglutathione lyase family enzyme
MVAPKSNRKRPATTSRKRPARRVAKRPTARGERPAAKPAARSAARRPAKPALPPAPAAGPVPSAIGAYLHHADYTTHDLEAIKRFYTGVLGFSRFTEDPRAGYLSIRTGTSSSLGFMAPAPGPPEQWRPPGEPGLYFLVNDVDRVYRELLAKGVEFEQPPSDRPWGHRMAICRDPEGRMVCLAQDKSR